MTTKQKVSNLTATTTTLDNDVIYIVQSNASKKITLQNLFNYANANVRSNVIAIANVTVPASANSTGTVGTIRFDSNYIYIAVAQDTWKRANLYTW